ncbi:hypothetical protein GP486_008595 [Trichoglossum hirsutum]|uniref:Uncharacterized protein n=1 Tax=Trichoglossum hirsutum TaxID=265104 RepID=A0A9P8I5Z4_9PEZI|nr:hypothetical protein GP486_008595 [Trichoglossum hirsutum]
MDWLLITDIPRERIASNDSRDWSSFVEGVPRGSRSQPPSRSTFVDKDKFNKLTSILNEYYEEHRDKHCPHSRIHGSGCESGLSDGQLLVPPVILKLNNMASTIEWTFKPRRKNGLGTFGDSGTWLYTAWGELLGQVLAYDSIHDVGFYTPMYLIFDHIKKRMGASDIQLPTEEDYPREEGTVKSLPLSTLTTPQKGAVARGSVLSSLLTPPEEPSDRDARPAAHPLACLASEGVCCSHSIDRSLGSSPPVWEPDSQ